MTRRSTDCACVAWLESTRCLNPTLAWTQVGATVVECACVVELKMFVDPPADSGLPSRSKSWKEKGIDDVPVWGLISEDVLTLAGELPEGYVDDGEEH